MPDVADDVGCASAGSQYARNVYERQVDVLEVPLQKPPHTVVGVRRQRLESLAEQRRWLVRLKSAREAAGRPRFHMRADGAMPQLRDVRLGFSQQQQLDVENARVVVAVRIGRRCDEAVDERWGDREFPSVSASHRCRGGALGPVERLNIGHHERHRVLEGVPYLGAAVGPFLPPEPPAVGNSPAESAYRRQERHDEEKARRTPQCADRSKEREDLLQLRVRERSRQPVGNSGRVDRCRGGNPAKGTLKGQLVVGRDLRGPHGDRQR